MSLLSHLAELRKRVIICVVAVTVGAGVGFALWDVVLRTATEPYCEAQSQRPVTPVGAGIATCQLVITSPIELLTTRLEISAYIGMFLASPVLLWQVWRFVTPGLDKREKRYAIPFILISIALFVFGALVAWFTFPRAIEFFLAVGGEEIATLFNPGPYLELIFLMMAAFGFVFETPLLLVFLQMAGVVSSRRLRNWRRQAIVVNFALAALITPSGDPYSLLAMSIPMCVFYEIAIIIGRVLRK